MGQVNTIAVIGAGIMGRGIAHVAALGGYRTILEDLLPNALRKAEDEIRVNLDKAVELGKISAGAAESARGRLEYAGSVEEAAREADLVIEAVPEDRDLHLAGQDLPPRHHSGVEYVVTEYHGNCQRHLSSDENFGDALFQSCTQDETAGNRARP